MAKQKQYSIQGTITDQAGNPMASLFVQAFDLDSRSQDDFLGEVETDQEGRYRILYTEKAFVRPIESEGPDFARAVRSF